MNIAAIKQFDISNGPGVRVSIFVSGCSIHCKGCHNQAAWDFSYGECLSDELLEQVIDMCDKASITGLSILGGEPLDKLNRDRVLELILKFKERFGASKDIWLWTGYKLEDLKKEKSKIISKILQNVDAVIDGPFQETLRDVTLKYRGSSNQRILLKSKNK